VEGVLVAEAVQIELDRSQLDDLPVRDVAQMDGGKVGIAGAGTEAGEFGVAQLDQVVPLGRRVRQRLERGLGDRPLAVETAVLGLIQHAQF
jgi:hypothetical protein